MRISEAAADRMALEALRELPAVTRDGFRVETAANIAGIADVPGALEAGAESAGVLRTEFLFLDRADMPSEEEQFEWPR